MMIYIVPMLPLVIVLSFIFWRTRPRCYTCKKRKMAMHFNSHLDCHECRLEFQAAKTRRAGRGCQACKRSITFAKKLDGTLACVLCGAPR